MQAPCLAFDLHKNFLCALANDAVRPVSYIVGDEGVQTSQVEAPSLLFLAESNLPGQTSLYNLTNNDDVRLERLTSPQILFIPRLDASHVLVRADLGSCLWP